jgi:hypothetical protein
MRLRRFGTWLPQAFITISASPDNPAEADDPDLNHDAVRIRTCVDGAGRLTRDADGVDEVAVFLPGSAAGRSG